MVGRTADRQPALERDKVVVEMGKAAAGVAEEAASLGGTRRTLRSQDDSTLPKASPRLQEADTPVDPHSVRLTRSSRFHCHWPGRAGAKRSHPSTLQGSHAGASVWAGQRLAHSLG